MLAKSIGRIETDTKKSDEEKQRQVLTNYKPLLICTSVVCNTNIVINQIQFYL